MTNQVARYFKLRHYPAHAFACTIREGRLLFHRCIRTLSILVIASVCFNQPVLAQVKVLNLRPAQPAAALPSELQKSQLKVALVIGNGKYAHAGPLSNPANDAEDLAKVLRKLNFQVVPLIDGTRSQMESAIEKFAKLAEVADVGLVFFAGHGMQYAGLNYLLPTDAKVENPSTDVRKLIGVHHILEDLQRARSVRVLIIDACRNNDALQAQYRGNYSRGLTRQGAAGVLVAYATQANTVAQDGLGRNSPFTSSLLRHIETPGLEINTLFTRVRADVALSTNNAQVPETSSSLITEFSFR